MNLRGSSSAEAVSKNLAHSTFDETASLAKS
jgi:hypothetical protein